MKVIRLVKNKEFQISFKSLEFFISLNLYIFFIWSCPHKWNPNIIEIITFG